MNISDYCMFLNNNYGIRTQNIEIEEVSSFPHIKRIKSDKGIFYLKKLFFDENKRKLLEDVYSNLDNNLCVSVPIRNRKKEYISDYEGEGYVLTNKLDEFRKNPNADWWANTLYTIHDKKIKLINQNFDLNSYFSCENALSF